MLKPGEARPSTDEARRETKKRQAIVKRILPRLRVFADAVLVVGSLAFAKDYAVRKSSDIDLLVLIHPEKIREILHCDLFKNDTWCRFAAANFKKNVVQHFSLSSIISNVKVEFHFWNTAVHARAARLEIKSVNRLSRKALSSSGFHRDFWGTPKVGRRQGKEFGKGYLHEYPVYEIRGRRFIAYEPVINLVLAPDILLAKDGELERNIATLWRKLAKRLASENDGRIDLSQSNILNAMPGSWNAAPAIRKKLQRKTKRELSKIGVSRLPSRRVSRYT